MSPRFSDEEFIKFKKLLTVYEWGLSILMTKLNIIHRDLLDFQDNAAIESIRSRIKEPLSIASKLHKKGVSLTAENAKKYLNDMAGIRIITPFAKDIYFLVHLIHELPGVKIIKEKDFISDPKPSGYRSYHLIVQVPVFYSNKEELITIEIQIRTEAMNFWSNLEHKARYKYREQIPHHLSEELVTIADKIAELDHRMFLIHEIISLINE